MNQPMIHLVQDAQGELCILDTANGRAWPVDASRYDSGEGIKDLLIFARLDEENITLPERWKQAECDFLTEWYPEPGGNSCMVASVLPAFDGLVVVLFAHNCGKWARRYFGITADLSEKL